MCERSFVPSLALVLVLCFSGSGRAQSIFTVAGGGTDDGRPATLVALVEPSGIAVDHDGNLFIAHLTDNRVRVVVAETGLIDTVAGNGIRQFSGDGGLGTDAELDRPQGIALDDSGNLYIADLGNHRIRRVDAATGFISTVVGSSRGFSGDGGPATDARIDSPRAVAIDHDGNLYIADGGNNRIRRVDAATGFIATVAGNGEGGSSGDGGPASEAQVDHPSAMTFDSSGNLFFAEPSGNRIRMVNVESGVIDTVAGNGDAGFAGDGGPATEATLNGPAGVVIDSIGNLLVADTDNKRVRRIDGGTGIITTAAGTSSPEFSGDDGPATEAGIGSPTSIALDTLGNLYIESREHSRVRRVGATTGIITTVAGNGQGLFAGDGRAATAAGLSRPEGLLIDPSGNIYVASWRLGVRKIDAETGIIATVAGNGVAGFSGDGGPATAASISSPDGLAMDSQGNLYISDVGNLRVRKVDAVTGIITTVAGHGDLQDDPFALCFLGEDCLATEAGMRPEGIAVDGDGNLYIADTFNNSVRRVDGSTGIINSVAGGPIAFGNDADNVPATLADLFDASGIALDSDGNLFIATATDSRVRRVDAGTGIITTIAGQYLTYGDTGDGGPAGEALLGFPRGIFVDETGDVYISDSFNYKVRKVDSETGIISTVAGIRVSRFSGDGGPATQAGLARVDGIAVDALGNVYVSDLTNNRVRKINACLEVDVPVLTTPSNGSQGLPSSPSLGWNKAPGALSYDVYLDTTTPPQKIVATSLETTSFSPANLQPLTTYYWTIIAKGDPYCDSPQSALSETQSFTTTMTCEAPGTVEAAAMERSGR